MIQKKENKNKWILLFNKDALNWLKVTIKIFIMLTIFLIINAAKLSAQESKKLINKQINK